MEKSTVQHVARFETIVVREITLLPSVCYVNRLIKEITVLYIMCMLFLTSLVIFSVLIMMYKATCSFTQFPNPSTNPRVCSNSIISPKTTMQVDFGSSCKVLPAKYVRL